MTKQEFNSLTIDEKGELLFSPLSESQFIDEKTINENRIIKIYSFQNLYVEIWLSIKDIKFEKIVALENERDWKKYLDWIGVEEGHD